MVADLLPSLAMLHILQLGLMVDFSLILFVLPLHKDTLLFNRLNQISLIFECFVKQIG